MNVASLIHLWISYLWMMKPGVKMMTIVLSKTRITNFLKKLTLPTLSIRSNFTASILNSWKGTSTKYLHQNMLNLRYYNISEGERRTPRWYFGGIAAALAACVTHPLDLLKVHLQTQKGKNISLISTGAKVIKTEGILGLYNGLSASLMRQLTYSTARIGIYESVKQHMVSAQDGKPLTVPHSILLATMGGVVGGMVGNPSDLTNVRMQNDTKLAPELRRNYKNVFHGIYVIVKNEGLLTLWTGCSMNCARSALMTIGQLTSYDKIKHQFLLTPYFTDNIVTHLSASLLAGGVATIITQPVDVLKTRLMNSKPGERIGLLPLLLSTAKESPLALFKGFVPAFTRIGPQTILTLVFLEQLRIHFGILKPKKIKVN